jgi:hypothetical protein
VRLTRFSAHPHPRTAFYFFVNCEADQNNKTGIKSDLAEETLAALRWAGSTRIFRVIAQNSLCEPLPTSPETPTTPTHLQPKLSSDFNSQARTVEAPSGSSTVFVKTTEANAAVHSDNKPQVGTASSTKASFNMTEANPMFVSNTKIEYRGLKSSAASSRIPVTMARAKSTVDHDTKAQGQAITYLTSPTKASLDWERSETEDPFGVRVSTEELGTMPPPFELALTGKFYDVRDNIVYLGGCRDATGHFEELPPQIIKPLQPGVDLTPEPVKAYIAANTAHKETAEADIKAAKAKELNLVGTQEVTTARGLHEEFENVDPTYAETMFVAIAAAKREPNPAVAYAMLSDESVRDIRAELKGKGKDHTSVPMEGEETSAKSHVHPSTDAPTEENEAPVKSWIHPVADGVIDKAQMHYNMMYDIVTRSKSFPLSPFSPFHPIHSDSTA